MHKSTPEYAIQTGSELSRGKVYVFTAPRPRAAFLEIAAQMAAAPGAAALRVIDAGNWFNAYTVASRLRQLADRSTQTSITPFLARIQVARAFTCFQVAALLHKAAAQTTPSSGPVLVLDILGAFHDENVGYAERLRLLRNCLPTLGSLRRGGPVLVSARPGDPAFTALLIEAADALIQIPSEPGQAGQRQLSFWEE